MSEQTTEMLTTQLRVLERKFRRACRQGIILNNKITDLKVRYYRALEVNSKSFLATLRLQLNTIEHVRDMYNNYAYQKFDELEAIQDQLVSLGVLSDSEEVIDWDED